MKQMIVDNMSKSLRQKLTQRFDREQKPEYARPEPGVVYRGNDRPWRIALVVMKAGVEVVFDLVDEMMLGHSHTGHNGYTGIDLSPFDVYEMGVSRRHAILQLDNDRLVVIDNHSTNGTQLNKKQMQPGVAYPLRNGDVISLGLLDLQVELLINPFDF